MARYTVYLTVLPMIILTNVLYPYPKQEKKSQMSLQNGLSMIDFLDMAELLFGVVGCYINYNALWVTFFFLSIGTSTILTAFTRGLEQPSLEDKDKCCISAIVTLANLLFNDVCFCILRVAVMIMEGHVYFGLIFVIKEVLSASLRGLLLGHYFFSYFKPKYSLIQQ